MKDDMTAKEKVDKCLSRLLLLYPFWGALGLSLEMVQSRRMPTLATDEVHLFFNPHYVHNQEEEILCTDLAHEISHKFLQDCSRRETRDPKVWNQATDYRINLMLKDGGFTIGPDYLIDERFRGMDAEEIYDLLIQEQPPEDEGGGGEGQEGNEKGQSNCGCGGILDPILPSDKGNG